MSDDVFFLCAKYHDYVQDQLSCPMHSIVTRFHFTFLLCVSTVSSCRIIGATTMLSVSAYGLFTRAQTPVSQRGHRAFLLGVSGIFAVAGIARATWPDKGQAIDGIDNASISDDGDR